MASVGVNWLPLSNAVASWWRGLGGEAHGYIMAIESDSPPFQPFIFTAVCSLMYGPNLGPAMLNVLACTPPLGSRTTS
jgi:hypothetical protein